MSLKSYASFAILFVAFTSLFDIDWLVRVFVVAVLLTVLFFVKEKGNSFPPTYEGSPKKFENEYIAVYTSLNTSFSVFGGTMFEDGSVVKFGVAGLKVSRSGDAKMYVLDRFGNVNES